MKKYYKVIVTTLLMATATIILHSCKKNKASAITIEGFDVLDETGAHVTHIGPADNDWAYTTTLSAAEMTLFDFPVSYNLQNTTEATLSSKVLLYPNPAPLAQKLAVNASDSVLMKIVIADRNLKVLTQGAVKFTGDLDITLDYSSDSHLFTDGASLRFYYSFSALGKPNFKTGYGDIKICYNATPSSFMDCF